MEFALSRLVTRLARCNDVRLGDQIDEGGALGLAGRHYVIADGWGVVGVGRADRQNIGVVAGSFDGAVALRVEREVATIIADGDDDNDAGLPASSTAAASGSTQAALPDGAAGRKIDDFDVVLVLEQEIAVVDGRDEALDLATWAVGVQHLEVDQADARSDAGEGVEEAAAGGVMPVASDEAGDVRAVAVAIVGIARSGEVANSGAMVTPLPEPG